MGGTLHLPRVAWQRGEWVETETDDRQLSTRPISRAGEAPPSITHTQKRKGEYMPTWSVLFAEETPMCT